jgi:hypothetical protein
VSEFLSGLKVEQWYHVFVILGGAGVVAAMTVDLKGIDNPHALLIAMGFFFVGVGEWINHPLQTKLVPPNIYMRGGGKITGHPRNASLLGSLFDVLGFVLLCAGIYKIIAAA